MVHANTGGGGPSQSEYHAGFLAEYAEAVEKAKRPDEYTTLAALLRLWRLRAAAHGDPGFRERLVAMRGGDTHDDVPVEQLITEWPPA